MQSKGVPNLGKYNDISDYVLRDDYFSEVDMEEIQTVEDAKSKTTKKISIRLSVRNPLESSNKLGFYRRLARECN